MVSNIRKQLHNNHVPLGFQQRKTRRKYGVLNQIAYTMNRLSALANGNVKGALFFEIFLYLPQSCLR